MRKMKNHLYLHYRVQFGVLNRFGIRVLTLGIQALKEKMENIFNFNSNIFSTFFPLRV